MSVLRKLPADCVCAYLVGVAVAHRSEWMYRAREAKRLGYPDDVKRRVRFARNRNRELVDSLRVLRARGVLETQP